MTRAARCVAEARIPIAPLSLEHLQLAWRQMRRPATWPATLDETLTDPARAACLEGYARAVAQRLGRAPFGGVSQRAHGLPQAPVPPTPTAPPARRQREPARFDARRAAANDFDVD